METLPAKLGSPDTAEAGRGLAHQLKSLASPSRVRNKDAVEGFLEGVESSPMGPARSSYREMLQASGQQALLRVQNYEPQSAQRRGSEPCPPGKLGAFGGGGREPSPSLLLPSLLLSSHLTAMGDCSTRSAPCLPSSAFSLPPASLAPSPMHLATTPSGTPMVAGCFPDMSPMDAGSRSCRSQVGYWPERSLTFCMERLPEHRPSDLLAFAMQPPPVQPPPQVPQQAAPDLTPGGSRANPYLMAIAMPQARQMSWDGEQIAAQLRAAAPEVYED